MRRPNQPAAVEAILHLGTHFPHLWDGVIEPDSQGAGDGVMWCVHVLPCVGDMIYEVMCSADVQWHLFYPFSSWQNGSLIQMQAE